MSVSRTIVSRYPGTCCVCGKPYRAGDRISWTKGNSKLNRHVSCGKDESKENDSNSSSRLRGARLGKSLVKFQTTWQELKQTFLEIADGNSNKVFKVSGNRSVASGLSTSWKSGGFYGATTADMKDWLANGFYTKAFSNIAERIEARPRRRIKYSEEGELQYDLMRSGFDYPFLEWEKREGKPGLKIDFPFMFSAATDSKLIADYSAWIAKTIYALETEGYDLEIGIRFDMETLGPKIPQTEIRIVVKEANEASDYAMWSALFSPGGVRMLGFTSLIMAGEFQGMPVSSSLGRGDMQTRNWGLEFEPDTRTLKVTAPYHQAPSFPADEMDEKLAEALSSK